MEENRKETAPEENIPKFRGLYRHVKISVKALDWIIGACIAAIVLVVAFELRSPGLDIRFDARGGTDVAAITQMYGEKLVLPEPPTREGYRFTGWYKDSGCEVPWNAETDTVETDTTLYAGWEKIE